jgi:hypothetical protein
MEPVQRQLMALMTANLASNALGVDGVIISKVHGGMARVERALVAEACEKIGVKTTLMVNVGHSGVPLAEQALFNADTLNAVVNVGQTLEKVSLPKAYNIIGGTNESKIYNPEFPQKAGDEKIEIEGFLLAGFHSYLGDSKIRAVDY